jgi:ribosomal protein S27E
MKTRKRDKEPRVTPQLEFTAPCPFCGEASLVLSPSGKHLVCIHCGRIVLRPKPRPAPGPKPA